MDLSMNTKSILKSSNHHQQQHPPPFTTELRHFASLDSNKTEEYLNELTVPIENGINENHHHHHNHNNNNHHSHPHRPDDFDIELVNSTIPSSSSSSSPSSSSSSTTTTTTYTSLRDIIDNAQSPKATKPASPHHQHHPAAAAAVSSEEVAISNPLVKQAAIAYLQPKATPPEVDGRGWAQRLKDYLCLGDSDEEEEEEERRVGVVFGCLGVLNGVVFRAIRRVLWVVVSGGGEQGRFGRRLRDQHLD